MQIRKCEQDEFKLLADIWERSVRDSHSFLSEKDIAEIRSRLIPEYFPSVRLYVAVIEKIVVGFIGIAGNKIEMLFVDPQYQRSGIGTALIRYAVASGADKVDVNEQNQSALAFYKTFGFHIISRDATDQDGRPFPILHLAL